MKLARLAASLLLVTGLMAGRAAAELDIGLPDLGLGAPVSVKAQKGMVSDSAPITTIRSNSDDQGRRLIPLTPECIKQVSAGYGVHPDILFAILLVEGGEVGKTNAGNGDGTKDLSLFQINEINLPELKENFGITREDVLNNGCLGAAIAARHLLRSVKGAPRPRNRMEYLSLLARYHSKTPEKNAAYALKLAEKLEYLESIDSTYGNR